MLRRGALILSKDYFRELIHKIKISCGKDKMLSQVMICKIKISKPIFLSIYRRNTTKGSHKLISLTISQQNKVISSQLKRARKISKL